MADSISVDGSDLARLQRKLIQIPPLTKRGLERRRMALASQLVRNIQYMANRKLGIMEVEVPWSSNSIHRRRGPRRMSGRYVDSWHVVASESQDDDTVEFGAGSSAPQAKRLEFGFVGTDSLGRHYNQAPRPHIRPAIKMTIPGLRKAIVDSMMEAIKES